VDLHEGEYDDATVEAVGKLSEALEWVERARGRLFDLHQMIGHADLLLDEAAEQLTSAGHGELADEVRRDLIGRNVLEGRWTFQIVEEFDDGYYREFTDLARRAREDLVGGHRHLFEARLKEQRRTAGRPGHEAAPR
jgi:hypothetical protein